MVVDAPLELESGLADPPGDGAPHELALGRLDGLLDAVGSAVGPAS